MRALYKKIASNTIAQILSKAATAIISIFLIGILTKYLPMELYGSYNKIYSYLGIFAFLADLGLYTIAIREISQGNTSQEKIIGNILSLRTILALGIWILALFIALFLPGYHDMLTLTAIAIVGGFTLVSLINSSLLALMQSQMKMEFSLFSLIAGKLINLGLIAFFLIYLFSDTVYQNMAFLSIFVAGCIGIIINTLGNYLYLRKSFIIRYSWDSDYIKYLFKISLPYGLALFLSVVYFKVDIILLSLLEPTQKADISIALYGLPMKMIEVLMVLGGFYLNSLLPSLTQKFKNKQTRDIAHIFGLSLKVLLSFAFLIFLMGNLFAKEILSLIATPEYLSPLNHLYSSLDAFRIVLGVLVFYFLSLVGIYMLIASEKQSILLKINIFVTFVNIIGNIIFIPYFSFIGSAYVTLVSQICLFIITLGIVWRDVQAPNIYIIGLAKTLLWGTILFGLFSYFSFWRSFGILGSICSIGPVFLILYVVGEYVLSKNILKQAKI